MPEGDSVHRLAERLAPLEGRRITHWDARVPALATSDLTGYVIQRVWAHGKHLFWELGPQTATKNTEPTGTTSTGPAPPPVSPANDVATRTTATHDISSGEPSAETDTARASLAPGSYILHTHLRMEGTWRIHKVGTRWSMPWHTARLVVRVEGCPDPAAEVELVGHDLGLVELWRAEDHERRAGYLGPDPLADDWSTSGRWEPTGRDEAVSRLSTATGTIGEALMDQRIMAGVGNEYRNEACFLMGVDPRSPVTAVDPAHTVDLLATLMGDNRSRLRTFTGVDRDGERTFVFGRNHRPCRRCGTLIKQSELGGATTVADPRAAQERVIWWCPTCQLLAGPATR